MRRRLPLAIAVIACMAIAAACTDNSQTQQSARSNASQEQTRINEGVDRMADSQQLPTFDFSQERQTLLDVLTVRAEGTHGTVITTSLDGTLLWWCPSLGAPVPSTYQVTGSTQYVDVPRDDTRQKFPFDLAEPTGVYPGDSAATWVLCLDDAGVPFAMYDEAQVRWVSGILNDLPDAQRARVDEVTFDFTIPQAANE